MRKLPVEEHRQIKGIIQILWSDFPHQNGSVLVVLRLAESSLTWNVAPQHERTEQARIDILLLENV